MEEEIPKDPSLKKQLSQKVALWAGINAIEENASEEERKIYQQKLIQRISQKTFWLVLLFLPLMIAIFWMGRLFPKHKMPMGNDMSHSGTNTNTDDTSSKSKIKFWTCSMHPQIKLPTNDAKCPLCFMDLVPVMDGEEDAGERSLVLSESARKLAEVETTTVEYVHVTHQVRMVGKITYDETKVVNISLWTPGTSRLNRMFIDFTGAVVQKGQPLVEVYSPDLIAAQGEYLSAYNSYQNANNSIKEASKDNMYASERKLLDLGMTKKQIENLKVRAAPEQTTVIFSPVSGTVTNKLVNEGEWHGRGMSIYQIADLSDVWVKLDAYESDMRWIRYAQEVEFETEAYPGEIFKGRVAFIDPFLNEMTRSIKLRVNVSNVNGKLKPGMFVRAMINVRVAEEGQIMDDTVANKWICPVHPDVLEAKQGVCTKKIGMEDELKCQEQLVSAQQLHFVDERKVRSKVLAIPYTAPLITGKRAVVYVEERKKKYDNNGDIASVKLIYHGIEVKLGPRAGDFYIVLAGLEEGQQVVTKGAFKLDSALQIMAKPSMMSIAEEKEEQNQQHEHQKTNEKNKVSDPEAPYHKNLQPFIDAYLTMGNILAEDKVEDIMEQKKIMEKALGNFDMKRVPKEHHLFFMQQINALQKILNEIHGDKLPLLRRDYLDISDVLISYMKHFGHTYKNDLYIVHCPMYRHDMGGSWLQSHKKVTNPYFGSEMLRCGDIQGTISTLANLKGSGHE